MSPPRLLNTIYVNSSQLTLSSRGKKVKPSIVSYRHMGEWRYSSSILDLGTKWRWMVRFMLRPLYSQGKFPGTH
jgi:hypothetical protein